MATNHVTSGPNFTSLVILKKKLACCKCRNDKSILDKKKVELCLLYYARWGCCERATPFVLCRDPATDLFGGGFLPTFWP